MIAVVLDLLHLLVQSVSITANFVDFESYQ
jgi:hypothetical protein